MSRKPAGLPARRMANGLRLPAYSVWSPPLDGEAWKPVPVAGFETVYRVSNMGRIRRVGGVAKGAVLGVILKPRKVRDYHQVVLRNDPENKYAYIHQLVARAFIGEPPGPLGAAPWPMADRPHRQEPA